MWPEPCARIGASADLVQPVPTKVKQIVIIIAEMKVFILKNLPVKNLSIQFRTSLYNINRDPACAGKQSLHFV